MICLIICLGIFVLANDNLKKSVKHNFSLHAKSYDEHSIIQKNIAIDLVSKLNQKFASNEIKSILDLGCGSGTIYKEISKQTDWELDRFVAVDLSSDMCDIHPKDDIIELYNIDFDEFDLSSLCEEGKFDLIISSSALQWSNDLSSILNQLKNMSQNIALNIFTNGTFRSIWEIIGNHSPIQSKEYIIKIVNDTLANPQIDTLNYDLEFDSPKDMFKYIKKSGVGSSSEKLSFKDSKRLLRKYDKDCLEFEIVRVL